MPNRRPEKKMAFTFGRFNPPTKGHLKLLDKLEAVAEMKGAVDYKIYLSHTQKLPDNPLPYNEKLDWLKKSAPHHANHIDISTWKNIFQIAVGLWGQGVTDLIMVVGQDRVDEFQTLLEKYNGQDARHGFYEFEDIEVISAGERDPDAEGATGASASKARKAAKEGNLAAFKKTASDNLNPDQVEALYMELRDYMGVNEGRISKEMPTLLGQIMAEAKNKGPIRKGHFKDYDKYYHTDKSFGTGQSDTEEDASSRRANQKMVDDVQKHLWKKAKVNKDGDYIIPKKAWNEFFKAMKKDIKKYGASSGEGEDS